MDFVCSISLAGGGVGRGENYFLFTNQAQSFESTRGLFCSPELQPLLLITPHYDSVSQIHWSEIRPDKRGAVSRGPVRAPNQALLERIRADD